MKPMMARHVLIVFEYGSINGGENSFLAVMDGLRELGWRFSALVPPDTELEVVLHVRSVVTHPLKLTQRETGIRLPQHAIRQNIERMIETIRPDIVHCNSLSSSRLCGPVCRELNVPSLGYLRDIIKLSRRAIDDINQLDRIVAVSDATRDFHVAQGISAERSTTIYNGVDAALLAEVSGRGGSKLLLYVGQIGLRKGIDTLLESFYRLLQKRPQHDVHLLIVGQRHSVKQESIDYEQNLHRYVARQGLTEHVHWLGRRDDVPWLMKQCDLLVHAARQEPLGRVLLEAAALGLPIVATDVGGTREILHHPELADCLAEVDQPDRMAEAINRLLSDETLRENCSQHLQEIAQNRFKVSACVQKLDQCYREICH